ncbi:MAG: HD domain-containing phosphohydrolase [Pirellulaceae bacterium]
MPLDFDKLGVGTVLDETLYSDSGKLLLRRGSIITEDLLRHLKLASKTYYGSRSDPYMAALPGSDVSRHGCKPYNPEQVQRLQWRFESASETVDDLASAFVKRKLSSTENLQELTNDYIDEMSKDMDQVMSASSDVPEDQQLAARCIRMGILSMAIGIELGLGKDDLIQLGIAAVIHDWGLFTLPADMRFLRPDLTVKQRVQYSRHPHVTHELLQAISHLPPAVMQGVLHTHERLDGSGFPNGLRGQQISKAGRILAVADTYLFLTSPLGDLPAVVPCDAVAYILGQLRKGRFDPWAIRGFLQALAQFPIGSLLQLSDNRQVKVLR